MYDGCMCIVHADECVYGLSSEVHVPTYDVYIRMCVV